MASKPIIKPITPFDATKGVTIEAQYSGSLPFHNRVEIYDASNLLLVYARTRKTSDYKHFVDPDYKGDEVVEGDTAYALENGKRYLATIRFYGKDVTTEVGLVSDKQSFLTRTTPVFSLQGLQSGDVENVIATSTINLTIVYSQHEFEKLLNFKFLIYDSSHLLLQETPIMYDTSNLSYSFKGLENMSTYYVRAEGTTESGIHLDTRDSSTGKDIRIFTQYENPAAYARMLVSNDPNTSNMNYRTNFIIAEADEGEDFQFENGWIHLENGETCTYSAGFFIEEDATIFLRIRQAEFGDTIFRAWGDKYEFYVEVLRDTDDKSRIRLVVPNAAGYNYMLYSDSLEVDWVSNIVNIWIRKIGNIYLLKAEVESDGVIIGNTFVGLFDPLTDEVISPYIQEDSVWISVLPIRGIREVPDSDIYYQDTEPTNPNQYSIWVSGVAHDDTTNYDWHYGSTVETDPNNTEQGNTESSSGTIGDNGEPEPGSGGDSVDPDTPDPIDINDDMITEQGGTDSTGVIGENGEPEPGSGDSVEP